MRENKFGLFILFVMVFIVPAARAQTLPAGADDEKPVTVESCAGDFLFNVNLPDHDLTEGTAHVSGKTKMLITTGDPDLRGPFTLYYFLDGRIRQTVTGVTLPHVYKRNYAGLTPGSYPVHFLLVAPGGACGAQSFTIRVGQ